MPFLAAAVPAVAGVAAAIGAGANSLDREDGDDPWEQNRPIDKNSFNNGMSQASRDEIDMRLGWVDKRTTPQMQAAQQSSVERYGGAQQNMAPWAKAEGVQLGPSNAFTAAQGQSSRIVRQDDEFRRGQAALAHQLQEQAAGRGPSLAEGALRRATDRNIKQQMAVTAAQGGNPALARRNAALRAAELNRGASADAAQMKIQEQLNARQQLAGVLDTGRAQDIGVNTSQAGFDQSMGLANLGARNTVGLANADAANKFALTQGGMDLQNNQFNAGSINDRAKFASSLEQQAGLANQSATNEMLGRNTQNIQDANRQNMESQLQKMGLDDAQIRFLLDQKYALDERNRDAAIRYEGMATNQDTSKRNLLQTDAQQDADRFKGYFDSTMSAVGSMGGAGAKGGR